MKKILVAGSSIAAGSGFPLGVDDPGTWPNQLKTKLNCHLDNVSLSGNDTAGIFLNATRHMLDTKYDLVLLEVAPLNRLLISPNVHGQLDISGRRLFNDWHIWKDWFDLVHINKKDLNHAVKVVSILNSNYEHWNRLLGAIAAVQVLNNSGHTIRFVNNGLDWDRDFFDRRDSPYARYLIDANLLPNETIEQMFSKLEQHRQTIDLNLWINPFDPLSRSLIDFVSNSDQHPGPKSNDLTSNLIIDYLEKNKLWND